MSANALTGNILVFYDSERTAAEIGEALGRIMSETGKPEDIEGSLPVPAPDARRDRAAREGLKGSLKVLKRRLGEAEEAQPLTRGTRERRKRRSLYFTALSRAGSRLKPTGRT